MRNLITNLKSANEGTISWFCVLLFISKSVKTFVGSAFFYCGIVVTLLATLGATVSYGFFAPAIIFAVLLPACSTKS